MPLSALSRHDWVVRVRVSSFTLKVISVEWLCRGVNDIQLVA